MNSRQVMDAGVLAAATGLTRFAFRSRYLYDIDSVNFALSLRHFDVSVHQPHPPGYFLYMCLGRLANTIFHDANTALVAISIAFSCAAATMIYMLTDNWFGRRAALFAGLIFLFSPLAWFHGVVALTYIVEAFFSTLVGYLCWRIYSTAPNFVLPGAVALGVAAGFRPSSILLLGPLFIYSLRNVNPRQAATGIGALILALAAWFLPMVRAVGAEAYLSSLLSLWLAVPGKGTVFNSSVVNSIARAGVIAVIYLLCFGSAAILPFLRNRGSFSADSDKAAFTQVWIAPGLLFFTFVYLKFVNSGYLLILFPPLCLWMGLWASRWYGEIRSSAAVKMLAVGGLAAVNTAIFIFAPVYCSYGEIRRFEAELSNIITVLPHVAPEGKAMIVGMDSHFLGYRHAGYYLPGYLTVQFPEVSLASGTEAFAMRDRETRLESRLSTASLQKFILFPLPLGDAEYTDYMESVRRRIPVGDLRFQAAGGHEFAIGPVTDLPFLFPVTASAEETNVHTR